MDLLCLLAVLAIAAGLIGTAVAIVTDRYLSGEWDQKLDELARKLEELREEGKAIGRKLKH